MVASDPVVLSRGFIAVEKLDMSGGEDGTRDGRRGPIAMDNEL